MTPEIVKNLIESAPIVEFCHIIVDKKAFNLEIDDGGLNIKFDNVVEGLGDDITISEEHFDECVENEGEITTQAYFAERGHSCVDGLIIKFYAKQSLTLEKE